MKKILFTGFEPFGGEKINPSWEAVRLMPDETGGAAIIKAPICVEYAGSGPALRALIEKHAPDAVVCCGQAGGRKSVTPEMCAINMDHAGVSDNAGETRRYAPISRDGAAAYFTSAPVEKIVAAAAEMGLPCAPSFHAGTYVCNHIYYTLLDMVAREKTPRMGLFIHVPYIPGQTIGRDAPSMELRDIARVLETAAGIIAESL
jgi:pyroglutamyl-peptidase